MQTDRAAFLALGRTTAFQPDDDSAWHRGRSTYAVWIIDFAEPGILAYLQCTSQHFADLVFHPHTRQPHVTVFVSGFLVESPQWDDDYTQEQCRAQQQRLRQLTLPAFDITLGAVNSFASALYVEVHDSEGGLAALRHALQEVMPELRWAPYVPHVTLGMYRQEMVTPSVVQRIERYALLRPIRKRVTQVTLATYAAQEHLGPLRSLYTHTF
jgi:2'-5' RNA ligase